jgi:hypothetical protein
MAAGLGLFEPVVELLQRQFADPQQVEKLTLSGFDQAVVAGQYFDIAERKP